MKANHKRRPAGAGGAATDPQLMRSSRSQACPRARGPRQQRHRRARSRPRSRKRQATRSGRPRSRRDPSAPVSTARRKRATGRRRARRCDSHRSHSTVQPRRHRCRHRHRRRRQHRRRRSSARPRQKERLRRRHSTVQARTARRRPNLYGRPRNARVRGRPMRAPRTVGRAGR
jgi:hypothetical protein